MSDDVGKANAQTEFMNDCVPFFIDEGKDQDQAVAICLHLWEGKRWRLARARAEQLQAQRRHAENKARFAALRYQPHPWRALRHRAEQLLVRFDPDEPRDEDGKWTDGGGGGGDGSGGGGKKPASEPKPAVPAHANPKVREIIDKVPGAQAAIDRAVDKLARGKPSDAQVSDGGYKRSDGLYTAPRQKVHAEILEKIFTPEKIAAATPKPGEKPTAHLLGGSGGSGKGWFTKADGTVRTDNAIYLNSDDMKAMLPDYKGWNAPLLHEESSELLRLTENIATAKGLNVIIDGTMGKYDGLAKRIDRYKDGGYRVEGHFMRVTPETSATRALQRFVRGGESGRYVPPEMLLAHPATANFEKARSKMDAWEMYDNEGTKPKFVSRG
jgi:predicted ABC-type ATPase